MPDVKATKSGWMATKSGYCSLLCSTATILLMETEPRLEVRVHNRLVDARIKLSLTALRVFVFGVTRLSPRSDRHSAGFSVAEYTALIGASSHSVHDDLRAAAKELLQAEIEIPTDDHRRKPSDKREWETVRLITDGRLDSRSGEFELEFTDAIIRYIVGQRQNSSRFDLRQALALTSKHAFRWFMLVKSWQGNKDAKGAYQPFIVRLEELRTRFGIATDEYRKYSHFRARVLDDSIAQLHTHTDLCFRYRPRKKSRKVVQLAITLLPKTLGPSPTVTEAFDPPAPTNTVDLTSKFKDLKETSLGPHFERYVTKGWMKQKKTKRVDRAREAVDYHRHLLQLARDLVPPNPGAVAEREKLLTKAEAALAALDEPANPL